MAERRRVSRSRKVAYVRLHLEDLEQIERLMSEHATDDPYRFAHVVGPAYSGDSVADVVAHEDVAHTRDFTMAVGPEGVALHCRRWGPAEVTCDDVSNLQARGLADAIVEILIRRRLPIAVRTLRRFHTYVASYLGFGLTMYAFLTQRSAPGQPDTTTYWVLNLVGWMCRASDFVAGPLIES